MIRFVQIDQTSSGLVRLTLREGFERDGEVISTLVRQPYFDDHTWALETLRWSEEHDLYSWMAVRSWKDHERLGGLFQLFSGAIPQRGDYG